MPTSGATASQNPNTSATCTARPQLNRSPPSTIAVRKLSRLRVNPRMRRLPITAFVTRCQRFCVCDLPRPGGRGRSPLTVFSPYSGSANANSALPWDDPSILGRNPSAQPPQPLGATMYCRPSMLYVDGLLWWPLPHWNCHSSSPLLASHALNSPVGSPPNTRSPPVVSSDEHMHRSLVQRHRSWPVRGS